MKSLSKYQIIRNPLFLKRSKQCAKDALAKFKYTGDKLDRLKLIAEKGYKFSIGRAFPNCGVNRRRLRAQFTLAHKNLPVFRRESMSIYLYALNYGA